MDPTHAPSSETLPSNPTFGPTVWPAMVELPLIASKKWEQTTCTGCRLKSVAYFKVLPDPLLEMRPYSDISKLGVETGAGKESCGYTIERNLNI